MVTCQSGHTLLPVPQIRTAWAGASAPEPKPTPDLRGRRITDFSASLVTVVTHPHQSPRLEVSKRSESDFEKEQNERGRDIRRTEKELEVGGRYVPIGEITARPSTYQP